MIQIPFSAESPSPKCSLSWCLPYHWTPSYRPFRAGVTTQGPSWTKTEESTVYESTPLELTWIPKLHRCKSTGSALYCYPGWSLDDTIRINSSHWFFASDFLTSLYFIQGFCRHNTPQDSKHLQTLGANFIQQQAMLWKVQSQKKESKRVLTQVRHFGVIDLGSLGATWEVAQPFRKRWWL